MKNPLVLMKEKTKGFMHGLKTSGMKAIALQLGGIGFLVGAGAAAGVFMLAPSPFNPAGPVTLALVSVGLGLLAVSKEVKRDTGVNKAIRQFEDAVTALMRKVKPAPALAWKIKPAVSDFKKATAPKVEARRVKWQHGPRKNR